MMTNLFSIFDPSTNLFLLPFNWLSTFIGILFIPYSFWLIPNRYFIIWNLIINKLHLEFKNLLGSNKFYGSTFIFISLFSFVLFNNFLGLFPYIFTSTSHLTISLSISLSLWLSFMLYGWINNSQHMFIHMIPQGTHANSSPFMVIIETFSKIIPTWNFSNSFSCSKKMASNRGLYPFENFMGNSGANKPNYPLNLKSTSSYSLSESAVALIQSSLLVISSTLYSSESN
uniref:ATP synthase subunit a n=1 Tax=Ampittia dioscorides TaxID=509334 RepID=A0A097KZH0_9NEOP|nr:ATP synthase F0 subunit 6 [Ampittia dioscorides]